MKVAVYHPFHDLPDNYSLSHVVREQMLMLTEHGVETHFVTSNDFHGEVPEAVHIHSVLPFNDAKQIRKYAEPTLKHCTAVLTHDIVYLNSYKDHREALVKIADKYPKIKWLHWSHSAPADSNPARPFPNSAYIGMNYTDLPLLAKQFNVPEARCRVVYNSVSPDSLFDWHPFTRHLVQKYHLLDCDVLVTYPLDTGRFQSKGGYKIIKLIEKLREEKQNAKVVFVNAAANTKERTTFVKALRSEHVIFTSLEDPQYIVQVPRQVVRELFQISNLFPLLSDSEGCSLTLLEAGLTKNLIVLNEDFPPLIEFGGAVSESGNIFHSSNQALYMKVSSTRGKTEYNPNENAYYRDWSRRIIEELTKNRALSFNRKVLQRFNREWIWQNQLEPLLQ